MHKDVVRLMKEAHYVITQGEDPPDIETEDRPADHMDGLVMVEAIAHLISWCASHANPPVSLVTYWWLAMTASCLLVIFYDVTSIAWRMGVLGGIVVFLEVCLDAIFRKLRIRKAKGLIHRMHESIRGISTVTGA